MRMGGLTFGVQCQTPDFGQSSGILDNLQKLGVVTEDESKVLKYALSSKSLAMPIKIENKQRANILRNVLSYI